MTLTRAIALLALLASGPAFAQDPAATPPAIPEENVPPENDDTLTIGLGAGYAPSYEGSDNYVVIPGGAIRGKVSGHNFYTRGTSLYFDLVPEKPGNNIDLSFGPAASIRLNRTSRIRDARVRALGELDAAIELGGFAGVAKTGVITSAFDTIGVRVSYFRDVSDTHDSYVLQPAIEYGTPLSPTTYVGLSVSGDYVGDGYGRTYFGVTPAGALASGLPAYDLDGGWKNVSVGLVGNLSLSGDIRRGWSLFALGSYSRLLGDFKRSPIVSIAGDADQSFGAAGVAYTF